MTSRQARTLRRAAERKARKAEIKRQKAATALAIRELTFEEESSPDPPKRTPPPNPFILQQVLPQFRRLGSFCKTRPNRQRPQAVALSPIALTPNTPQDQPVPQAN